MDPSNDAPGDPVPERCPTCGSVFPRIRRDACNRWYGQYDDWHRVAAEAEGRCDAETVVRSRRNLLEVLRLRKHSVRARCDLPQGHVGTHIASDGSSLCIWSDE